MNKTFYFPDMRVNEGDLNNTEQSRADAVRQQFAFMLAKFAHQYTGSIAAIAQQALADATPNPSTYRGIGGGLNSGYLLPITGSLSQISVQRGWGITDGMDIVILTGSVTINQGDNDFNRVWGTLTNGQPAYVTAEYQEASASIGSDSSGNTYFKRYTGDFLVRVSATYPSGANQIPLAQFTANGNLITVNTFQDRREWARPWGVSDSILDKSPVVVSLTTLYDHTHAVGSGIPTVTNPHGTSFADLGFLNTVNGILLNDDSTSARQSYSASIVNPTSNAFLQFSPPFRATASVGGQNFTTSLAPLFSSTAPADGTYWVIATPVAGVLTAQWLTASVPFDQDFPQRYPTVLRLGQVVISDGMDNIDSFTDFRDFYNISPGNIRADFVEATSSPLLALAREANLFDTLDRMRYQIGLALNGSGSQWNGANPLTSGHSSNGDPYHSHVVPLPVFNPPVIVTGSLIGGTFGAQFDNTFGGFIPNGFGVLWQINVSEPKEVKAGFAFVRPDANYTHLLFRYAFSVFNVGSGAAYYFTLLKQNRWQGGGSPIAYTTLAVVTASVSATQIDDYQYKETFIDISSLVTAGFSSGSVYAVKIETAGGSIGLNVESIQAWLVNSINLTNPSYAQS